MFSNDLEAGKNAEDNFWWFEGQLSKHNVLSPMKTGNKRITGNDVKEAIITEQGLVGTYTEIKALRNNNFIIRDNNPGSAPDPSGTLEFEVFSNAWDQNNKLMLRKYWKPGWLPKILHPERYNRRGITVVKPTRLVFMLCKDSDARKPYACINFEDFGKLEKRLYEIAPFDLNDIPSPLMMDYWKDEARNTMFNCWYVSFDQVKDLATITRILDVPLEPEEGRGCSLEIQEARCMNLLNSCNNPSFDRMVEFKRAQSAARAFNKNRRLPGNTPLIHMTYFDSTKLPSWVERYSSGEYPDWLKDADWTMSCPSPLSLI